MIYFHITRFSTNTLYIDLLIMIYLIFYEKKSLKNVSRCLYIFFTKKRNIYISMIKENLYLKKKLEIEILL